MNGGGRGVGQIKRGLNVGFMLFQECYILLGRKERIGNEKCSVTIVSDWK